jgi:hypothetical protein
MVDKIFQKGEILGKMELWEQHPASTHVHWAFRTPGDNLMPPPANIAVVKGFKLCGIGPLSSTEDLGVPEIDPEDPEYYEHGNLEVLDEEFEYDAEDFVAQRF